MISDLHVKTIDELMHNLNILPNNFVFRGQSDATWGLQSTLERTLGIKWDAQNARKYEDYSLDAFKSKYHIYSGSEHIPKSKLSWLSVMQHYGVPTRLIDFTTSPYIALYFALETYNPLTNKDLSIYCLDYSAIMEKSIDYIKSKDKLFKESRTSIQGKQDIIFDETVDRYAYDIAWITEPIELNARIDRQSGTFLISGNLEETIESIINSTLYDKCTINKIIIPSILYEGIYVALRKMSINSKSIYGDLSGLAKSIRMELQAYT
ncbi:FRG domain-containing protein [Chromobacterium paludis]|uniref:FRG domain-containing protein n=1 Tax=Chromobacterium paludis TaxID=2605945 RepID=A0A5C1DJI9_9NEIS|nr:FRG domain-containing protein [Chromobacterium paludis]QEL56864.1 FRG domain-containing protein [Chromobacterium paludis]